ncbi:hypothetical protein MPER_13057 [Moniliophthora perniciosa FA553]|nr:hypothetical protein MPER_13057 [Moniliophthora perniciosa FA553]
MENSSFGKVQCWKLQCNQDDLRLGEREWLWTLGRDSPSAKYGTPTPMRDGSITVQSAWPAEVPPSHTCRRGWILWVLSINPRQKPPALHAKAPCDRQAVREPQQDYAETSCGIRRGFAVEFTFSAAQFKRRWFERLLAWVGSPANGMHRTNELHSKRIPNDVYNPLVPYYRLTLKPFERISSVSSVHIVKPRLTLHKSGDTIRPAATLIEDTQTGSRDSVNPQGDGYYTLQQPRYSQTRQFNELNDPIPRTWSTIRLAQM